MFKSGLIGYLPATLLQGIIGFLSLMLYTRLLSAQDYGRYALAFGLCSLIHTLSFTWLESAMARFYPAEKGTNPHAPALFGTLSRLFILSLILMTVLGGLGLYLWHTDPLLKQAVALGLFSSIFKSLIRLVQEQRRSEGLVAQASSLDMIQTLGGFLFALLFIHLGMGAASPLVGVAAMAVLSLPFFAKLDLTRAIKGHFSREHALSYAKYGFPISASLILTLSLATADRFLIAHYMSEGDAGAYHAGFSLAARILDVLFIWLGASGSPAMINALEARGIEGLKLEAGHQIKTMALILFPAVAGLIIVSPDLGGLLIGDALRARSISVTPMITLSGLLAGLNSYYFLQSFTLSKKTPLLILAMAIPAFSNIALNIWLIPIYGLNGAALACVLSYGLGIMGSWALGKKAIALPLPLIEISKVALCALAMMGVVQLIPNCGPWLNLILKPLVGVLVYAGLVWLLHIEGVRDMGTKLYHRFWIRQKA